MRTEYIDYVLEVARSGSISAAAKKLYIGQTTLSAIVASVEEELNTQMFSRTHKGVKLTSAGEEAIAFMEDISNKNHALLNLQNATRPVRRTVHLVAYPTACNHLSLYLAQLLILRHQDVVLSVHETMYNKIIKRVSEGNARIAVGCESSTFFSRQMEALDNGLRCEIIYTDAFKLVVNRSSPLSKLDTVDVHDLYDHHIAIAHYYPLTADSPVGRMYRTFNRFTMFTNNQIIKQAVIGGSMIAIMPELELMGDPYVEAGELVSIPVTGFPSDLTIYLVYNEQGGLWPVEEMLLDEIRRYYRDLAPLA